VTPLLSFVLPKHLSHLTIRPATNADCERVQQLVFDVLAEFGLRGAPDSTDADLNDLERNYAGRRGSFDVIEDSGGSLVGTFGVYAVDESTCELRKMYFVPEVRGLGLGHHVLELALQKARELGFLKMVLETSSKLTAANRLYQQFGFKPAVSDHLAARADQFYELEL
jgi:putative acetyltransferase